MQNLTYIDRLYALNLNSLERRGLRVYLVYCLTIVKCINVFDMATGFKLQGENSLQGFNLSQTKQEIIR